MSIDYKVVGDRVRSARVKRGYTSEELSELVDLAPESLRHIENGSSKPSLRKLYTIAEVLNVSLDYLAGRTQSFQDRICDDFCDDRNLTEKQMNMLKDVISDIIPSITKHL